MRLNNRNKQEFWYALYAGTEEGYDEYGNQISTYAVYGAPVKAVGNISPAKGMVTARQFGDDDQYDKVLVVEDQNTPIDENTVLWIEKNPYGFELATELDNQIVTDRYANIVAVSPESSDGPVPWDYVVRRVARSLPMFGCTVIAISKVSVS